MKSKRAKLNDRPRDTFSGEAGDEMSVPRRKENGTAPKRVACQSPADRTAEEINHKSGKEGILPMAGEIFMRVNEVAEELGVSALTGQGRYHHAENEEKQPRDPDA